MLDALITSKTRIKLLLKFFLNSKSSSYLRNLESEFNESTNSIRLELNRFEKAGLLVSNLDGNKKMFRANTKHPLFPDIHNLLMKHFGIDQITERVINKIGEVNKVYVTGEFSQGRNSEIIDLVFIGDNIDKNFLISLIEKVETLIKRKIRYIVYKTDELKNATLKEIENTGLLIWEM